MTCKVNLLCSSIEKNLKASGRKHSSFQISQRGRYPRLWISNKKYSNLSRRSQRNDSINMNSSLNTLHLLTKSIDSFPDDLPRRLSKRVKRVQLIAQPLSNILSNYKQQLNSQQLYDRSLDQHVEANPVIKDLNKQVSDLISTQGYYQHLLLTVQQAFINTESITAQLRRTRQDLAFKLLVAKKSFSSATTYKRPSEHLPPIIQEREEAKRRVERRSVREKQSHQIIQIREKLQKGKQQIRQLQQQIQQKLAKRSNSFLLFSDCMFIQNNRIQKKINHLDNRIIKQKRTFLNLCQSLKISKDPFQQEILQATKLISWDEFKQFSSDEILIIMNTYPQLLKHFKPIARPLPSKAFQLSKLDYQLQN